MKGTELGALGESVKKRITTDQTTPRIKNLLSLEKK
jgi:hypothetical protein